MRNIFIIHGSYGSPNENWFPWLKKELEKLGNKVFAPQFPIPPPEKQDAAYGGHKLSSWLKKMSEYKKYINDETIIIAHSRGNIFTYNFLMKLKKPVSSVFLVAPWIKFIWYPKGWKKIDSFHKKPFDWKKIKNGANYFEVFQSTNDVIPVSEGQFIADKLQAKINIIKNAGHFNTYTYKKFIKFPFLLEKVKSRL
jgi:predicted alpha/beta hydrolase family esterase